MVSLERLNGLRNLPFDSAPSPQVRKQLRTFHRAIRLMIDLGERSAIEAREANHAEPGHAGDRYLVIEDSVDPETQVLVHDLKQLLDLDPERSEFRITDRITQRKPDEITIRIRSLITLMGFLSRGIEVPEAHAQEGRALPTATFPEADDPSLHSLMKVSSSLEQPVEAFVAVRYQNYWFYIPHSDQQSKQAFTLLTYLFQMQALPEAPSAAPVITVPAG
jgi:hypothetical protein